MNKNIKITLGIFALIFIFLNLFQVYENKYIVALCYLIITILLFLKAKGN